MAFFDILRPKGITAIVFSDLPTHVSFQWGKQEAVVFINQQNWQKLSVPIRYFVLMHEEGHLKTMRLLKTNTTAADEHAADDYAMNECKKVGFHFESTEQVRTIYNQQIQE